MNKFNKLRQTFPYLHLGVIVLTFVKHLVSEPLFQHDFKTKFVVTKWLWENKTWTLRNAHVQPSF